MCNCRKNTGNRQTMTVRTPAEIGYVVYDRIGAPVISEDGMSPQVYTDANGGLSAARNHAGSIGGSVRTHALNR